MPVTPSQENITGISQLSLSTNSGRSSCRSTDRSTDLHTGLDQGLDSGAEGSGHHSRNVDRSCHLGGDADRHSDEGGQRGVGQQGGQDGGQVETGASGEADRQADHGTDVQFGDERGQDLAKVQHAEQVDDSFEEHAHINISHDFHHSEDEGSDVQVGNLGDDVNDGCRQDIQLHRRYELYCYFQDGAKHIDVEIESGRESCSQTCHDLHHSAHCGNDKGGSNKQKNVGTHVDKG
ncbi:hypothetical protein V1264_009871 [Littorina saxatilis]|uniref:Uncharacterized protein n=1 Tax=Littorina saxatilis TaxID=31220 RepID=A0AAN9ANF3_9CAEN